MAIIKNFEDWCNHEPVNESINAKSTFSNTEEAIEAISNLMNNYAGDDIDGVYENINNDPQTQKLMKEACGSYGENVQWEFMNVPSDYQDVENNIPVLHLATNEKNVYTHATRKIGENPLDADEHYSSVNYESYFDFISDGYMEWHEGENAVSNTVCDGDMCLDIKPEGRVDIYPPELDEYLQDPDDASKTWPVFMVYDKGSKGASWFAELYDVFAKYATE